MGFLALIDDHILKIFTDLSHGFQKLTGRTNYFLAKIALVITLVWVVVRIGNFFVPVLVIKTDFVELVALGVLSLFLLLLFVECDRAEAHALRAAKSKYFFGPFLHEKWFRVFFMVVLTLIFILFPSVVLHGIFHPKVAWYFEIIDLVGILAYTAFLYLINVDPLPPTKSKAKAKRSWREVIAACVGWPTPKGAQT